jgi:hypothetical protein
MAVGEVVAERNSLAVHFGLQDSKTVAMCPHGVHMVSMFEHLRSADLPSGKLT